METRASRQEETTIVARLDKDGLYVLCGRRDCGARLALIFDLPAKHFGEGQHDLMFGPGWKQEVDGIWGITKHAQSRLRHYRYLASGNPHTPRDLAQHAQSQLSSGAAIANRRKTVVPMPEGRDGLQSGGFVMDVGTGGKASGRDSAKQAGSVPRLPAKARCPDCRGVNRLEPKLTNIRHSALDPPQRTS